MSYDFVGMARAEREAALPGVPHIHFNGASGNVAAGKYNDGTPANRPILADRLAAGMNAAWKATQRTPITGSDLSAGGRCDVKLPLSAALEDETPLVATCSTMRGQAARSRAGRGRPGLGPPRQAGRRSS